MRRDTELSALNAPSRGLCDDRSKPTKKRVLQRTEPPQKRGLLHPALPLTRSRQQQRREMAHPRHILEMPGHPQQCDRALGAAARQTPEPIPTALPHSPLARPPALTLAPATWRRNARPRKTTSSFSAVSCPGITAIRFWAVTSRHAIRPRKRTCACDLSNTRKRSATSLRAYSRGKFAGTSRNFCLGFLAMGTGRFQEHHDRGPQVKRIHPSCARGIVEQDDPPGHRLSFQAGCHPRHTPTAPQFPRLAGSASAPKLGQTPNNSSRSPAHSSQNPSSIGTNTGNSCR